MFWKDLDKYVDYESIEVSRKRFTVSCDLSLLQTHVLLTKFADISCLLFARLVTSSLY